MTIKEREQIFAINEALKKVMTPPQTTNTGMTGAIIQPPTPQPTVYNLPVPQQGQTQG